MMLFRALALLALLSTQAGAQSGQIASGTVWGNSTAARAIASPATLTAMFDRALGGTQGTLVYRNATAWVVLGAGTVGQVLTSGGAGANISWTTSSGAGTVTSVGYVAGTGLTLSGTASPITTTGSFTYSIDKATAANYYAAAANKVVATDIMYPSEVTVTYGLTTTFDFDTFINGVVTLTGNITTQTFSNVRAGKAGTITFIQDATGSRTTVWNTILKWASGTAPVLTTTANAVDVLSYSCRSATFCVASLMKNVQ